MKVLKVVNVNAESSMKVEFDLQGAKVTPEGAWDLLTAADLQVYNSFRTPDAIIPEHKKIKAGNQFTVNLPAHSVSVITLQVEP